MLTKYGFDLDRKDVVKNLDRLTNQLWKLIPMRENHEDWQKQLQTVLVEIVGLREVFNFDDDQYLVLLTKLEGMKKVELEFIDYRRMVFESISLMRNLFKHDS